MKIRADTWRYFCVILCVLCATFLLHKNIKYCARLRRLRDKNMLLRSSVKNICGANSVKFCAFCVK